jgi:hypothetical protein
VEIVQGVSHGTWAAAKVKATTDELLEEQAAVTELIGA